MDLATIVGLAGAFGALIVTVFIEGSSLTALILPGPLILVFGATIGVGVAGTTLKDSIGAFKLIPKAFQGKRPDLGATAAKLVELADLVRHNGVLALDGAADAIEDPFLQTALRGVADGTDSEELAGLLQDEIDARSRSVREASKFFAALGGYAPTVGIIGTVVSLTHVLSHLSTPKLLGPMVASAFIATLWGLLSANFLWLPLGSRLGRLCELEADQQEMVVEGVLAIQEGVSARSLGQRLSIRVGGRQAEPGASEEHAGTGGPGGAKKDPGAAKKKERVKEGAKV